MLVSSLAVQVTAACQAGTTFPTPPLHPVVLLCTADLVAEQGDAAGGAQAGSWGSRAGANSRERKAAAPPPTARPPLAATGPFGL